MMDGLLMVLLVVIYVLKNDVKKKKPKNVFVVESEAEGSKKKPTQSWTSWLEDIMPYMVIIFAIKIGYFFDREKSMNF